MSLKQIVTEMYGDRATVLTRDQAIQLLDAPSGSRPRVYGMTGAATEVIALRSHEDMARYPVDIYWTTSTSVADLVKPA